jgi:hypothetical protein
MATYGRRPITFGTEAGTEVAEVGGTVVAEPAGPFVVELGLGVVAVDPVPGLAGAPTFVAGEVGAVEW